jgi:hypothetical protein
LVQSISSAPGWSRGIIRNSILFDVAVSAALLTIGLALFGRGVSRPLLAGSGLMLAIVAYGAVLQNGV